MVSVKYRYCWVADGRVVLNDVEPEGLSAGAGGNTSDTRVAELFLEVIVRHVPGRTAKEYQVAITEWEFATLLRVLVLGEWAKPECFQGKPGRTLMNRPFVGVL